MKVFTGETQRTRKQTLQQLRVLASRLESGDKEGLKLAAAAKGLAYDADLVNQALDWADRHR